MTHDRLFDASDPPPGHRPRPSHGIASKSGFEPPRRAVAIGMWLFLASLTMLFLSSIVGYVLIRTNLAGRSPHGTVVLPRGTWVSTAVLIIGSFTIHRAVVLVRREKIRRFKFYLYLTGVLAILFLLIQTPCLWEILQTHLADAPHGTTIYGLVFFLILLHALHVVGGIVAMAIVSLRAHRGYYDHEHYMGVRHAALYWHFLDIVWLTMFAVFNLTA